MTRYQAETIMRLEREGYLGVAMPVHVDLTPVPGLILMAKFTHNELLMILPSGETQDLLQPCGCGAIF